MALTKEYQELKLNEKLAEWAGFKYTPTKYCEPPDQNNIKTWEYWICPDGKRIFVLNFTNSLDACKWLVPKIAPKTLMVESYIEDGIMKFSVAILSEKQSGGVWCGNDTDPALALCQAIEKLIDKE